MKRAFFTAFLLLCFAVPAFCQSDNFLLPEDFFPHKGETLNLHLLNGGSIGKAHEQKFDTKNNTKILLFEGSKSADITSSVKENTIPVLSYTLQNSGLALIGASQHSTDEISKREFTDYLSDNGLDKMTDDLKQAQRIFKIRGVSYMKTLIAVDKSSGNVNEKILKDDFEIVLEQNPYKLSYGDDIAARVYFKGAPLKGGTVMLTIRTASGAEFPQSLSTNADGEIFFKVTREGVYLLKAINIVTSKDQEASDYDILETTFTFAFSSNNTMPNSYKEFGFGNRH